MSTHTYTHIRNCVSIAHVTNNAHNQYDSDSSSSDIDERESTRYEGDISSAAAEISSTVLSENKPVSFVMNGVMGESSGLTFIPNVLCSVPEVQQKLIFSWHVKHDPRLTLQSIIAREGCAAHKDALRLENEKRTTML